MSRLIPGVIFCFLIQFFPSFACTIGVFGSGVTVDNRPILWKNRDVNNPDQEVGWFAGSRYRFIANVYAGETMDVWAGINEAGFGIMNSNSYNLSGLTSADDGKIMRLALERCGTVDDFVQLMDSLNIVGRETPSNFGVFDLLGNAAVFEASNTFYKRYDCRDESLGFILRANYSMSGGANRLSGKNRFERAMQLCTVELAQGPISVEFIVRTLCRDLGQVGFDPYPLPFLGQVEPLPFGYLPFDTTISRATTRSVEIMVGPRAGAAPKTGMMWILLGSPLASIPIPLWVVGGEVPEELNGTKTALICEEAKRVLNWLCPLRDYPKAINTFRLSQWLSYIAPIESTIFQLVAEQEKIWGDSGPDSVEARRLTGEICELVVKTYNDFWNRLKTERIALPARDYITRNCTFYNQHSFLPDKGRVYDSAGRLVSRVSSGVFFVVEPNNGFKMILVR